MTIIDERAILESLRQVPSERWGEVLRFLDSLNGAGPAIRTCEDLGHSGLPGSWADREDLGSGRESARSLREQAESRPRAADAPGH